MATPPTRTSYNVPTGNYSTSTTPKTTAAFAVTAGDLIVVVASGENELWVPATPTASGGTVTWTQRITRVATTGMSATALWTGVVGVTAASITVSMAGTGGVWWGMSATVWSNHGGVGSVFSGNNGVAGSSAPSVGMACAANSAVQCVVNDWNAADGTNPTPGRTWRTINGAAQTESLYFRDTAHHAVYGGYSLDTGAAGTITQGLTTPATQRWILAGVEVLGTGGAAPGRARLPRMASQAVNRAGTF